MNLLLLTTLDRIGSEDSNRYVVRGERASHVRDVLRSTVGQSIRVGLLDGPLGVATVVSLSDDALELSCFFDSGRPDPPLFDLVVAVPRPKSLRKLLPDVVALGVGRIVLLRTWRVQTQYLSTRVLDPLQYRPLLHEGLMQGRRTIEPNVSIEPLFKPFVEDRLDCVFAASDVKLVAHVAADLSIADVAVGPRDRVVGVIGPEGGLLPYEVMMFEAHGFRAVRLGPSPLRVETACVALMAQIELLREQSVRRLTASS